MAKQSTTIASLALAHDRDILVTLIVCILSDQQAHDHELKDAARYETKDKRRHLASMEGILFHAVSVEIHLWVSQKLYCLKGCRGDRHWKESVDLSLEGVELVHIIKIAFAFNNFVLFILDMALQLDEQPHVAGDVENMSQDSSDVEKDIKTVPWPDLVTYRAQRLTQLHY